MFYSNVLIVSAHYMDNGKVEIGADPKLLDAYITELEQTKLTSPLAGATQEMEVGIQLNEDAFHMLTHAEPTVLDSEEHYWQFVSWIRTQHRLPNSQVVSYIEANVTLPGTANLHPIAIRHVNYLNPGVVIFFTATKSCREQTWGWIERNRYSKHPILKHPSFKDCLASPLTKPMIDSLPIVTVYPRPFFAVIDKTKHTESIRVAIPPTLLERFCCFKRKAGAKQQTNVQKVGPTAEPSRVFRSVKV